MKLHAFLITLCSLLFTACGGGGGGSSTPSGTDPAAMGGQTNAGPQSAFSGQRSQSTNALVQSPQILSSVLRESGTTVFGSVLQSISSGFSPASAVDTSYTGDRFTLQVTRQDGSTLSLDTGTDDTSVTRGYTPSQNPVTNRPAVDGYTVKTGSGQLTVGSASIEWSNTDFGDYLAGGYWMHFDANQGIEFGAFIDGPDYDSPVTVPASGTATYNGRAAGIYVTTYGPELAGPTFPVGSFELGDYEGRLMLTADFGANTISGNINNIGLFYRQAFTTSGHHETLTDQLSSGYILNIGSTPITQNGQFRGTDVALTHPSINITSTDGSWAGRFSSVDDSSGNPQAVAGTHRGYIQTFGGTQAIFIGAHYGATERFQ